MTAFGWLRDLQAASGDAVTLRPPPPPERIAEVEQRYGMALPRDFRAFLTVSDGAILALGEMVLSVDGLLRAHERYGFAPWSGRREVDTPGDPYRGKPRHWLVFLTEPFSPDAYAWDTRRGGPDDWRVVHWDPEEDADAIDTTIAPSFEAVLLMRLYRGLEPERFPDGDAAWRRWSGAIGRRLEKLGADVDARFGRVSF